MRILLIRHGRSAHVSPGGLLDRVAIERWRTAYDASGIVDDCHPPAALVAEVARADAVAASDLPRAIASAQRLAPGREVAVSPLFREVPLPIPASAVLRAPFAAWGTLIYLRWAADLLLHRHPAADARERARAAAAWCREACLGAAPGSAVAVVTHGAFRRMLAQRLVAEGWRREGGRGYAHWSVWRFAAPDRAPSHDRRASASTATPPR
ncbi:MAG TPA: histidine phosphatase family protein [Longimicrobium sp.]|nr:histidine phosphatase family protein [Longimicrobium sp.]